MKNIKGFTLLEMVISVAILAVITQGMLILFINSYKLNEKIQNDNTFNEEVNIVKDLFENIINNYNKQININTLSDTTIISVNNSNIIQINNNIIYYENNVFLKCNQIKRINIISYNEYIEINIYKSNNDYKQIKLFYN